MDDDPFPGYGLQPVNLTDQATLNSYLQSLRTPLSDYTFSQLFTWRNSLRILWSQIEGHLCVFANGTGDLTMLIPPVPATHGAGDPDKALAGAWDVMRAYNADHGVVERTRIEYASEELLALFDRGRLNVQPMGTDYVYDIARMIDLAGGDLASKRQAKNRFLRNYPYRVEPYCRATHLEDCRRLLNAWKERQDASHAGDATTNALKRQKESLACDLTLEHADVLGLCGIVVYVKETPDADWSLRGFTFGETLGPDQSSIVVEKTDLAIKGLAQFIFSEFCRSHWADRPRVNVGDDWGLESLAWTKMSYRPVQLLQKYSLTLASATQVAVFPAHLAGDADTSSDVSVLTIGPVMADAEQQEHTPHFARNAASPISPSPGTPGEGRGEGSEQFAFLGNSHGGRVDPHPNPLPEYRAREQKTGATRSPHARDALIGAVPPEPRVRLARKDDLAAAVALEQTCFDAQCISKRQLQYLQQRQSTVFLVAEHEGTIIGQGISLIRQHRGGASGRIYSLAVSHANRGRKIGRKIMLRMIDELGARGVKRVYLEVESENQAAIRLYHQLGFRRIGQLPDYYGDGRHALHMMRPIRSEPTLFDLPAVAEHAAIDTEALPSRLIAGAMSGTSADGVDVALVRITGHGAHVSATPLYHRAHAYPEKLRQTIFQIRSEPTVALATLAELARDIAIEYADAINDTLERCSLHSEDLTAVAAHGQTLFHAPPLTIQWFDPALLAARVRCMVISDFRRADCAAGGQGAPLVPLADRILFGHPHKSRALLNLGGIANITYLPAAESATSHAGVLAFDTGPANCISDYLIRTAAGASRIGYDAGGALALAGAPSVELARTFLDAPYFMAPPPKTTDIPSMIANYERARIHFRMIGHRPGLEEELATACLITAFSVVDALQRFLPRLPDELIASGGGTSNLALMKFLRAGLDRLGRDHGKTVTLTTTDALGIPTAAKEAIAFALLGAATLDGHPGNVPSATGARRPVVLGAITPRP